VYQTNLDNTNVFAPNQENSVASSVFGLKMGMFFNIIWIAGST
jgi:hypothetical protein